MSPPCSAGCRVLVFFDKVYGLYYVCFGGYEVHAGIEDGDLVFDYIIIPDYENQIKKGIQIWLYHYKNHRFLNFFLYIFGCI